MRGEAIDKFRSRITAWSTSCHTSSLWDEETITLFEEALEGLKRVEDLPFTNPPPDSIRERTVDRFFSWAREGREELLEAFSQERDVLHLLFNLDYGLRGEQILDSEYLETALHLFHPFLSDSILSELVDVLIRNWLSLPLENRSSLIRFLEERLTLTRPHSSISLLYTYRDVLFAREGPYLVASHMVREGLPLSSLKEEYPFLKHYAGVEYVGEVLLWAVELSLSHGQSFFQLQEILALLKEIDLDYISCHSLASILVRAGRDPSRVEREEIKDAVSSFLGDGTFRCSLSLSSSYFSKGERLLEAKRQWTQWLAVDYLEILFESIEMERDRRTFWLEYMEYLDYFCLYCGESTLERLKEERSLGEEVMPRIKRLEGESRVCAFAVSMKGKVYIDFCRKGHASYAYDIRSPYSPQIEEREALSMEHLKRTSEVPVLSREYDLPEFRLIHRKGWQDRLKKWFSHHITERGPTRVKWSPIKP